MGRKLIRKISVILGLLVATSAVAEEKRNVMFETRDMVTALAFDPAKFFTDDRRDNLVQITYRGDDYDWPVYAIAIRDQCLKERVKDCHLGRRARMVRAPAIENMERPRWRGTALIGKVAEQKPSGPEAVADILETVGMEWVEADLMTCPNAMRVLAEGNDLEWIKPDILAPSPDAMFVSVLHADTVVVEFPHYLRKVRYDGYMAKGSPAAWANRLAHTLEPCWQPAQATAPWLVEHVREH